MPLPEGLQLRAADAADLPRIAELRQKVGWSVHEWALRAVLRPPHARCVVAVDGSDRVVAIGSGISYGRLGIVGNMIVEAAHRRRGIGAAILGGVMEFLEGRGSTRMELYATSDGRPLYAEHGFEPTGASAMVRVPRALRSPGERLELAEAGPDTGVELAAYDAPRFGGDRRMLLREALDDPERPLIAARRGGEMVGYGWIRPDGERIGPLVADTPEIAAAIIGEAFGRMPQARELTLNVPSENGMGAERLVELGAEREVWDGRMARGPDVPRRGDTIYGNVVGALG
ncbi:MAG: GNAT family N-acetyltransferase [Chloroflexi bacterium]|nr:GNAT family N-acetyltransferase [Chloroflexota bacterium]